MYDLKAEVYTLANKNVPSYIVTLHNVTVAKGSDCVRLKVKELPSGARSPRTQGIPQTDIIAPGFELQVSGAASAAGLGESIAPPAWLEVRADVTGSVSSLADEAAGISVLMADQGTSWIWSATPFESAPGTRTLTSGSRRYMTFTRSNVGYKQRFELVRLETPSMYASTQSELRTLSAVSSAEIAIIVMLSVNLLATIVIAFFVFVERSKWNV
jgi:hypothetical protein